MTWLFKRFKKTVKDTPTTPVEQPKTQTLREQVVQLYEHGVYPVRAIMAMMYEVDGALVTDAKRSADIWLGINDLLERDEVVNPLRTDLVRMRDVLGECIEDTGEGPKALIQNYRADTRKINEMKLLQSYKPSLMDADGVMQLDAFQRMLSEIEDARANDPGSLAQDISPETLQHLYDLRDNWDSLQDLPRLNERGI